MDLRLYYDKIRAAEAAIVEEFPIVISQESPDGGKAGQHTEVPRRIAARLLVEGIARLATGGEAKLFRDLQAEARAALQRLADAARVQVTMLAASEMDKLKAALKAKE